MSVPFYPPPSFCFALSFDRSGIDASFHEISGLKVNWTYDEVEEGGQNRFVHKLPKRTEHSNLILKRGVLTSPSPLAEWLKTAFAGAFYAERAQPKTLTVQLRNALGLPLVEWKLEGAYPVSWDHSALNAEENNLLIETMELSCRFFERKTFSYADEVKRAS